MRGWCKPVSRYAAGSILRCGLGGPVLGSQKTQDVQGPGWPARPSHPSGPDHAPRQPSPSGLAGSRSHLYSAEESRPHRGGPGGPLTSLPQSDKFLIGHTFSRAATTATTTTATCSTVGPAHWPRVSTRPRPRLPAASSYWLAGPGPLPQSWAPGVSGADWPKAGARRGLEAG